MKLHIYGRSGEYLCSLEVAQDATADDLKRLFCAKYHYYPERQRFTIGSAKGNPVIDGLLSRQNIKDETSLWFKDLGVQISWRLVFVLEYLGPLIILPLFWFFPSIFYPSNPSYVVKRSQTQLIGAILFMAHYIKRELETLFIHRFSNATMPIVRLPINCFHYWILCGVGVGYYLCHPLYRPPFNENSLYLYSLSTLFVLFEILNWKTHLILRGLRPRGTKKRGIPEGWGFQWVSCANYLWESAAWLSYSFLTMTLTGFLFTLIAFAQMLIWALKKHTNYKRIFSHYPSERTALIPLFL